MEIRSVAHKGLRRLSERGSMALLPAGEEAMSESKGLRPAKPVHPGQFVRTVVLDGLELSVTEAAQALGVTRVALSRLLNGQASLSPEMAIRLDKAFGVDMETLMRMQNAYDIAQAKQREGEIKVPRFEPKGRPGNPQPGLL